MTRTGRAAMVRWKLMLGCALMPLALIGALASCSNGGGEVVWIFTRNNANFKNGRLRLSIVGGATYWETRAGSGSNNNECIKHNPKKGILGGPLPAGSYTFYADNKMGGVVHGPVLRLPSRLCRNGTVNRTDLYVHSTYPWQGANNYSSYGCVKVSNAGWDHPFPHSTTVKGDMREVWRRTEDLYFPKRLIVN